MNKISPLNFTFSRFRFFLSLFLFFFGIVLGIYTFFFYEKETNDIVFLIDNSLSMSALDIEGVGAVRISRLDAAKQYVRKSIEKDTNFRVSLVSFSAVPQVLSPLSDDRETTLLILDSIDTVPYGQPTNIRESIALFQKIYPDFRGRVVILSDGEDTSLGSGTVLLPFSEGVFIGIGTPAGARLTQGYDGDGKARYKEYDGKPVVSLLDRENIGKIAGDLNIETEFIKQLSDIQSTDFILHSKGDDFSRMSLRVSLLCILIGLFTSPYILIDNRNKQKTSSSEKCISQSFTDE